MELSDILLLVLGISVVKLFSKKNKEKMTGGGKEILNIFNEPLLACGSSSMTNGSWDTEGKCSEVGGGVHQICVKNISKNTPGFSSKTGQSNWSDQRGNDNHCVCLGAWSLYNALDKKNSFPNENKKVLKCEAIPKISLSKNYVKKFSQGWNKWNGYELKDQVKDGVESLVKNCYNFNNPQQRDINLKNNFCEMAQEVKVLKDTSTYKTLCL